MAVLRKGTSEPLPDDLYERTEREWDDHFKEYANAGMTSRREATQAFEQARRSAPLSEA